MLTKLYEPRREKTGFLHMRKQRQRSAKLISAFLFAIRIVQFLYYLNRKFQASGHLLWLYSPVCVGPGWKPRRPVFSERGSYDIFFRRSRATYSEVSGGILPKFELIQAFIVVLITCKNEEDPIRNEGARVLIKFSQLQV